MGPYTVVSYSPLWILMGPYKSLCVLMDSNGTVWVLVSHYAAVSIFMGFCVSLCVVMRLYGS